MMMMIMMMNVEIKRCVLERRGKGVAEVECLCGGCWWGNKFEHHVTRKPTKRWCYARKA